MHHGEEFDLIMICMDMHLVSKTVTSKIVWYQLIICKQQALTIVVWQFLMIVWLCVWNKLISVLHYYDEGKKLKTNVGGQPWKRQFTNVTSKQALDTWFNSRVFVTILKWQTWYTNIPENLSIFLRCFSQIFVLEISYYKYNCYWMIKKYSDYMLYHSSKLHSWFTDEIIKYK